MLVLVVLVTVVLALTQIMMLMPVTKFLDYKFLLTEKFELIVTWLIPGGVVTLIQPLFRTITV